MTGPVPDPALRRRLLTPADGPIDVVIDTDVTNEIDDQFALVWALLRPDRLRVRALYACPYALGEQGFAAPGLVSDLDRTRIAPRSSRLVSTRDGMLLAAQECRRIAALVGVQMPVLDGASGYLPAQDTPVRSDATDHLIALAHEDRPGPLVVLGLGCATNLASALLLDPSILGKVVLVWTSAYPSFWPYPNASYNMMQDVAATRVLLESGVPLVYLPGYYVGEQLRVSMPELREHALGRGPVGDYLYDLAEGSSFLVSNPGASKVIWDLIVVAWALDPGWLTTGLVPTPQLGPDLRWQPGGAGRHLMLEATAVDRDAVYADLFRVLAG